MIRAGRDEQTRALLRRVREARAAFDAESRRELRDEYAIHVVLATVLRCDGNGIDVGANEGAVLSRIVAVAPDGRHIAYEPIPELCHALATGFPQVDVRCRALSCESGAAEFSQVLDAPAFSGLRLREDLPRGSHHIRKITVQVQRLDDELDPAYVPSLLKIDVEGAELGVLRGAAATLERHRPFVLFEHGAGGADLYGSRPGELFDLLSSVRLRIFDLDGEGPYTRDQFEAVFTEPIWNFLAAPA